MATRSRFCSLGWMELCGSPQDDGVSLFRQMRSTGARPTMDGACFNFGAIMRVCLEGSLDRRQRGGGQTPDSAPRAVHRASMDDVVRDAPRALSGEIRQ